MKILHLGAGMRPVPGEPPDVIHLDLLELPHIEIVCDLNHGIPLPSEQFEMVIAEDVIEHLDNPLRLMEEIWRVLKPNGVVNIRTANYKFPNAFRDITHKHAFTLDAFDILDPSTPYGRQYGFYTQKHFKVASKSESGQELVFSLVKIIL